MDGQATMATGASMKSFWTEEGATAQASSVVLLVALVGLLLAAGVVLYYAAVNGFFTGTGGAMENIAADLRRD
jgi:Flp pilus assembly pilin Flp